MLESVKNAFKMKEIRQKLLYTLAMMVVIRIGSQLPAPGIDRTYFSNWFAAQTGDTFSFVDAFTGGSFLNMSVLALNITPYITSSIIIQLLTIAIPKLEEMQKEGEEGDHRKGCRKRYFDRTCDQYHLQDASGHRIFILSVRDRKDHCDRRGRCSDHHCYHRAYGCYGNHP